MKTVKAQINGFLHNNPWVVFLSGVLLGMAMFYIIAMVEWHMSTSGFIGPAEWGV